MARCSLCLHDGDALLAEIAALKERLRIAEQNNVAERLLPPDDWALTPTQHELIVILATRPLLTIADYQRHHENADWAPGDATFKVHIAHLRRKMAPWGVELRTLRGRGVTLDDATRAAVLAALKGEAGPRIGPAIDIAPGPSPREQTLASQVLAALKYTDGLARRDIAQALGVAPHALTNALSDLKARGLIEHRGPRSCGYWRLTDAGRGQE